MPFPLIDVTDWPWNREERMGSKAKLWVLDDKGTRWLFKERRHDHGEDWAEKIAAETAKLLGIPHVDIELATRSGKPGVISRNMLPDIEAYQLEHGNVLLVRADPNYPATGPNFKITEHTVEKALAILRQDFISIGICPTRPAGITTAPEQFVGYLMLDALVGNTDRHHENWAIVVAQTPEEGVVAAELAPLYDTASCLGRERTDEDRARRLSGHPSAPTFEAYWRKMPSRWYRDIGDRRSVHPLEAFRLAANRYPAAAQVWLAQLILLTDETIANLMDSVPSPCITAPSRQFGRRMLQFGRDELIRSIDIK